MDTNEIKKWSKRLAVLAAFGVTGIAALTVVNLYRMAKGLDKITLNDLNL